MNTVEHLHVTPDNNFVTRNEKSVNKITGMMINNPNFYRKQQKTKHILTDKEDKMYDQFSDLTLEEKEKDEV